MPATTTRTLPRDQLDKLASGFAGQISVYVKDLATGAKYEFNPTKRLPTASICKVPVMIELFNRVSRGEMSLDERYPLSGKISRHGSGVLSMMADAPTMTLRDYCRLMITVSDNIATDFLINLLTPQAINATMDAMGFHETRTSMTMTTMHYGYAGLMSEEASPANDKRLVEAFVRGDPGLSCPPYSDALTNNVTSARDMGVIYERMYYGQIVSPSASHQMLEISKECQAKTKIPRHLKPDVIIAHKIGGSNRIQGDVGIVLLPSGPLVVSALTLGNSYSTGNGGDVIAEISRIACETFSPESVIR